MLKFLDSCLEIVNIVGTVKNFKTSSSGTFAWKHEPNIVVSGIDHIQDSHHQPNIMAFNQVLFLLVITSETKSLLQRALTLSGRFSRTNFSHRAYPDENVEHATSSNRDWLDAEFALLNFPSSEPSPDLIPEQVARMVCRSLQLIDHPTASAGLVRCFAFLTVECRKLVTARQGGQSVERFCEYGLLSPALQPFMGASRIELGEPTVTPAKPPLRGALVSYPVQITSHPVRALQYASGMLRNGVASDLPVVSMVLRLEQQRRPPLQGCWLVREILDVRHAFAGDMGNAHVGG